MTGKLRRGLLIVPILMSVAVPYAMVGESMESARAKVKALFAGSGSSGQSATVSAPGTGSLFDLGGVANGSPASSSFGTSPVMDLTEALQFNLTPQWVLGRWPRVSTTRANDGLDGLRVTLMTGTQPQDVAGSLTYYFDRQQQLQRIAMRGVTGDSRQLVSVVTRNFGLHPEPVAGAEVYLARWNRTPTSGLWIRRAPVVRADTVLGRYEFLLELNRAGYNVAVSDELQQQLAGAQVATTPAVAPPAGQSSRPAIQAVAPGHGVNTLYGGY